MPHVNGGGGDDLGPSDEIKVFELEGEGEEERKSSDENLKELKSSLVTEGENKNGQIHSQREIFDQHIKHTQSPRRDFASIPGTHKSSFDYLPPTPPPFGFNFSSYHHTNGALGAMVNKVPMVPPSHPASPLSFMMYNSEAFQPPPAHMGIPPVHIDPKTGESSSQAQVLLSKHYYLGIPRPQMYHPLSTTSHYHHHPMFSPEFTQQFQWHPGSIYPIPPYPGTLPLSANNFIPKFTPSRVPHSVVPVTHPGLVHHHHHHSLISTAAPKLEMLESSENRPIIEPQRANVRESSNQHRHIDKRSHIKKPLNAFMLYMKEMRSKVVAECTLKESAAINQILGRRWHSLSRDEQSKYYDLAKKERQLHMQLYPGWSARDNYAQNNKKKKRKRDKCNDGVDGNNPKKCRARYGVNDQTRWCKPCRRKKKCIRYISGSDNAGESEDNIGSVGSLEAPTPDSRCDAELSCSENAGESEDNIGSIDSLEPPTPDSRPKKNCIRYISGSEDAGESEDNISSVGSVGSLEAPTPDSRCDSKLRLPTNQILY